MISLLKYWAPAIGWMFLMFFWSTDQMSTEHTSRFIVPFLRWISPDISSATIAMVQFLIRKAAHLGEYLILALLLARLIRFQLPAASAATLLLLSTISAFAFALSDEFHQSFVPSRTALASDVAIDTAGAIAGLLLYHAITRGYHPLSRTQSRDPVERP